METKNDSENKIFMVSHAHFIFHSLSKICLQKGGETSSNTSLLLVQTSSC